METFLEHLRQIFEFILKETDPQSITSTLYDKIKHMTETHIMQRDIENFVAYFRLVLSTARLPKKLQFERKLIRAFIDRTYTEFNESAQEFRANRLYDKLKDKLDEGTEIRVEHLARLEVRLKEEERPTLQNIMEHAQIAMLLKWLQGPIRKKLSEELQYYITTLGSSYGKSQRQLVPDTEWKPFDLSKEDKGTIKKEYKSFESALKHSLNAVKEARLKKTGAGKYQEQLRVIISSLDNLVKMSEKGTLNSVHSFKDKVIVSTALIYIQDEFVRKDPQLRRIIQLLISLYYQFRDKH